VVHVVRDSAVRAAQKTLKGVISNTCAIRDIEFAQKVRSQRATAEGFAYSPSTTG
jgi:hypothetical protein